MFPYVDALATRISVKKDWHAPALYDDPPIV
jgi:hypothetical protein